MVVVKAGGFTNFRVSFAGRFSFGEKPSEFTSF